MKWVIGGWGYLLSFVSLWYSQDIQSVLYSGILMSVLGFLMISELERDT